MTSEEVNATKNVSVLDGINKHVYKYIHTYIYIYIYIYIHIYTYIYNFEKGQSKKWMPGGLKEFLSWIFAWGGGGYYVSCQKSLFQKKYGLDFSTSNVNLGLF